MEPVVATYSIAACDLDAGQWGVATESKFLAVGSVVPWARPGIGAVATQALREPALRAGRSGAARGGSLRRRGGRAPDGRRRRPRPPPARRRGRGGRQRDVHRQRVHGLGGRGLRAVLRGPGEHPRLRGHRRCDRLDLRGLGRPAARRAADRLPRRCPGGRRRPARAAVGGAARRRARRRLRGAVRLGGRSPRRRPSGPGRRARSDLRDPPDALREDPPHRLARGRRAARRRARGAARRARLRRRARGRRCPRGRAGRTSRSASTASPGSTRSCSRR